MLVLKCIALNLFTKCQCTIYMCMISVDVKSFSAASTTPLISKKLLNIERYLKKFPCTNLI